MRTETPKQQQRRHQESPITFSQPQHPHSLPLTTTSTSAAPHAHQQLTTGVPSGGQRLAPALPAALHLSEAGPQKPPRLLRPGQHHPQLHRALAEQSAGNC